MAELVTIPVTIPVAQLHEVQGSSPALLHPSREGSHIKPRREPHQKETEAGSRDVSLLLICVKDPDARQSDSHAWLNCHLSQTVRTEPK